MGVFPRPKRKTKLNTLLSSLMYHCVCLQEGGLTSSRAPETYCLVSQEIISNAVSKKPLRECRPSPASYKAEEIFVRGTWAVSVFPVRSRRGEGTSLPLAPQLQILLTEAESTEADLHPGRMSNAGVKCVTTPCVTSCPDARVVIHPPSLKLTLPGLILATSPGKTLVETETACLTNGFDGCSKALVTKSSGPRAVCGSTPCCVSTTPDSQLVIKPPPVCITIPGAVLTSFPNECLIATSQPCVAAGSRPPAITRSSSVTDGGVVSAPLTRSSSVPCGLDKASACVTQGPSSKVVIYPPPIELIIPGPLLEIAAEECAVEVHNPCENLCAITSGEKQETKALTARANSSTEVLGSMGASPCVSQGPEMKITIQPPPIEVDLPGPILQVFPEECKVETFSPCAPENPALCEASCPALTNGDSSLSPVKRPLPDIRRPPRPWAEIYSRSVTPRSLTGCQPSNSKHRTNFSSASCY